MTTTIWWIRRDLRLKDNIALHTALAEATAVYPLPNVWPIEAEKPIRFRIAEQDWLAAEMEAMLADLDIIGIFHSHPDNPPIASPRDLAWASWPGYSYIITEVAAGEPTHSRSWQLQPDRSGFVEEMIEIGD